MMSICRDATYISAFFYLGASAACLMCLLAGCRTGFMEDFAIVTLNTSRIGADLLTDIHLRRSNLLSIATADRGIDSAMTNVPHIISGATHSLATDTPKTTSALRSSGEALANSVQDDLNHAAGDLAKALGLYDFYSAHVLNYCEGYFVPGPVPNTMVPERSISKNAVHCSRTSLLNIFDPASILQQQLGVGGHGLADLHWPSQMNTALDSLSRAQHAMKWLYVAAFGLVCVAFVIAAVKLCVPAGVVLKFPQTIAGWAALLTLTFASVMATAFAVPCTKLINEFGQDLGISAVFGDRFLLLTWTTVGATVVALIF